MRKKDTILKKENILPSHQDRNYFTDEEKRKIKQISISEINNAIFSDFFLFQRDKNDIMLNDNTLYVMLNHSKGD